ncbi:TetR/AcrR family transcriptional regulator [Planosporangium flavigriseum]|uniref:TetR family transcriptional regulator n=1 Tax=Planosporangium flavigriseum TaxID=373681 RepID=A0A8J3LXN1_9ACTN|nr:TetR/AcrR family transcriptional regulator C-terminal domain-containing protein [Planosporangium flavigriseum]NJC67614.1 TetR/AcrR family transcriptional regulator [Planosporangium flavigriseum]GIG75684.1 TetR family transcriptional regulator [Planosporangium flavigriseum]
MPRKARLTERGIAEAALAVLDAEGLDALTMRRLATELSTSAMALYNYFPDKEAVLEAVTQLMLAEIEAPPPGVSWQETARRIMRSARTVALRHPYAATLIARFPPRTPDALAFVEAGFRSFRAAGFDPRNTARAYRTLVAYSLGTQEIELRDYFAIHPAARPPADTLDQPSAGRLLPTVEEVGPELANSDPEQEFEYGLNVVLTGLEALLPRP